MSGGASAARTIRCPGCGGASVYSTDNPFRPFCSDRCKNADFGAWASETYRLDAKPPAPEDEDPDAPFAPPR